MQNSCSSSSRRPHLAQSQMGTWNTLGGSGPLTALPTRNSFRAASSERDGHKPIQSLDAFVFQLEDSTTATATNWLRIGLMRLDEVLRFESVERCIDLSERKIPTGFFLQTSLYFRSKC